MEAAPMDSYVVAIGDPEIVKTIAGSVMYAEKENTFVLSVPVRDQQAIIKKLQNSGVLAHSYANYLKIIRTPMRFIPLKKYNTETVYDWQKTGNEYFGMTYSDEFEICSVDKKDVNVLNRVEPILGAIFSSTGAIIGFIRKNMVSLHVNESLDKIFDIKTDAKVERLVFSNDDRYLAICLGKEVELYNILLGKRLFLAECATCCFSGESAYFEGGKFLLDREIFEPYEKCAKVASDKDKVGRFIDGTLQKIVFTSKNSTQVKNQRNVDAVSFYFSESKMYVLITKIIKEKQQYFFESYSDKEITINRLDSLPLSISVEDNSYIICDSQRNLTFYQKERYNYAPVKSIKKSGSSIVAMHGHVACVFDSSSQTIEFYDKLSLRSVYAHHGCTSISWSQSGLYVAVFSNEEAPTSLVQIFSSNGILIHRKTYNKFTSFQWRPFITLTSEERASMEPFLEDAIEDDSSDAVVDVSTLLSEWKGYLLAKIQSKAECCNSS